jgi:hypothetical protein
MLELTWGYIAEKVGAVASNRMDAEHLNAGRESRRIQRRGE